MASVGWMMSTVDDQTAAASLWREHAEDLRRFATVLVGPFDAHDIVADSFWTAYPKLVSGEVANHRGYLVRCVARRALDVRRGDERRLRREWRVAPAPTVEPAPVHTDLHRALGDLTVAQRAVVYLAYWDDLTEREIAEALGQSAGSVHRTLQRARDALRKALR